MYKVKDVLPSNISCLFFSAAVHGKFQDLVDAQPYQTQLDQQSTVNITELCSCMYIIYSTSVFQEKIQVERELDHLHHIAKDNGFNFSFTIHNNNGFNHMI